VYSFKFRLIFFVTLSISLILFDYKLKLLNEVRVVFSIITIPVNYVVNIPLNILSWSKEQLLDKQTLQNKIKKLSDENSFLKVKLQKYNQLIFDNKQLKEYLNTEDKFEQYSLILALIIQANDSRVKKQITINKGLTNGIYKGQIVVGNKGIVGSVDTVGLLDSKILLITDPIHYIPVKSQRNGLRGIAKGKATHEHKMNLNYVFNSADIKVGDIFVSSALGDKFPKNYPVAKVSSVNNDPNNKFMNIELTPIENFSQLNRVLLLK